MRFFYAILSLFSFVSVVSSSTPTTQVIQSHPLSQKIQTPVNVHPVSISRVTNEPIPAVKKVVYPSPVKKVVYTNPLPVKKVVKKVVYSVAQPQPVKKVVKNTPHVYINRIKRQLNRLKQKEGKHVYIKDNDVKAYCQIFFTK